MGAKLYQRFAEIKRLLVTSTALLVIAASTGSVRAAPATGAQVLIDIIELAFGTHLTEAQRLKIVEASKGAAAEREQEMVRLGNQLKAEFATTDVWLEDTRRGARQWVVTAAKSEPALAAMVKAGDPNGAAPGLSLRARDAVIEMLLYWVGTAAGRPVWEGTDADLKVLQADVVRWYRSAPEDVRDLSTQADNIWGALRALWFKSDAAAERSKIQIGRELPAIITARKQGGRWWTHPAVGEAMRRGTFLFAGAGAAARIDLSLSGDSPYYEVKELGERVTSASPVTKREALDIVLFFAFALDAVLTITERDSIAEGFADPQTARSPEVQEIVKEIRRIVRRVRETQQEINEGRSVLRRQFQNAPSVLGEVARELHKNMQPIDPADPYRLTRQALDSIAEFMLFSASLQAGRWVVLDPAAHEKFASEVRAYYRRASPSERLAFALGDMLWGEVRRSPDYRRAVERLGAQPAAGAAPRASTQGGAPAGDIEALARSQTHNFLMHQAMSRSFNFHMGLIRGYCVMGTGH